jgi:hypothetical protein
MSHKVVKFVVGVAFSTGAGLAVSALIAEDPMDRCVEFAATDLHEATVKYCSQVPSGHPSYRQARLNIQRAQEEFEREQQRQMQKRAEEFKALMPQ